MWVLQEGDCLKLLPEMAAYGAQFDACITDPPYHLVSTVKRFGKPGAAPAQHGADGLYARASRGFMGKEWDGGNIAFQSETWRLVGNTLKPGAHLLAFGGTRTFHRMAVAIEDAGFELRDTVMWLYGSGFPKSHAVEDTAWKGWGTALKPAWEPVILARKPFKGTIATNILTHGTGALNIDASRIDSINKTPAPVGIYKGSSIGPTGHSGRRNNSADGLGRWPANVVHDGSDEVLAAFAQFGEKKSGAPGIMRKGVNAGACYGAESRAPGTPMTGYGDSGSAARFFYCAKANKTDRAGSEHPTVKPIALLRYLCKLVTPPNGTILDPFAGSGTLAQAADQEGFNSVLLEQDPQYCADIQRRMQK